MQAGVLFARRFRLERRAGRGGMGEVWRALDEVRGQPVALKLVLQEGRDAGARFVREARVLGELRHPAIVGYVAHGTEDDGTLWLAMDWLEGVDLGVRLEEGPLTLVASVALARRMAAALAAAHALGIVHRDVKPANVFLPAGRIEDAMLLDFGVARVLGASQVMTKAGVAIGTPGYMAPEQARGATSLDPRADVFALGCVLFECVAGVPVFVAETLMGLLAKVLFEPAPRLESVRPGVPEALDELVARLLAKHPEGRPADGAAVVQALDALVVDLCEEPARPSAPARSSQAALTGRERRVVSVLAVAPAVDIQRLSTAIVSPDATVVDAAPGGTTQLARVQSALGTAGGTLERLADGSLLWVLEAQGTATDQALRAAHAALAVRDALPDEPIAVATGWAEAASSVPVGDAIDRVVALVRGASVRPPWIALDPVTADLVRPELEVVRETGRLALVGKRADDPADFTVAGRPAPFVGRDRDLAALEGLVLECADERESCALAIVAPPGAGKSRLRRALVARLASARPEIQVLVAAPDGLDEAAPCGLVAALVRHRARLEPGAAPSSLAARLGERLSGAPDAEWTALVLAEVAGERAEPEPASWRGEVAPARNHLRMLAARADPRLWGDHVHRAVLAWLAAELERGPLLLVFEDLHAGDRASVELAGAALRTFGGRPLCVLGVGRPELRARFPELWSARRPTVLEIAPLTRRAAREFVRRLLAATEGDEVVERLVEQAEGSPFVLEELVRAHLEGRGEVPATIVAMVQSRLDALDPDLRRTLRAASVLGRTASLEAIGTLVGKHVPAEDVRRAVDELVTRDLLAWEATSRRGELEATFRVAAVREAAYASLTERDRILGHRLAAELLEREGTADPERVADHFLRAELPARAVGGLAEGARRAIAAHELERAVALADRAITCGASGEERGLVLLRRAQASNALGELRLGMQAASRAVELLPPRSELWCWAVREEVLARVLLGDRDGATARSEAVLAIVEGEELTDEVRTLLASMTLVIRTSFPGALADRLFARAQEGLAPGTGSLLLRARILEAYARDPRTEQLPAERLSAWDETVRLAEAMADRRQWLSARSNRALTAAEAGRVEGVTDDLAAVIVEADTLGLSYLAAGARHLLGTMLSDLGEIEPAIEHLEAAQREYLRGDERMNGGNRLILARALGRGGRLADAEREARRAVELLPSVPGLLPAARAVLAEILLARGDPAGAVEEARAARRLLDAPEGAEWGDLLVRRVHAEVLTRTGHATEVAQETAEVRASLEARAASIPDPTARAAYLRFPPDHAWFFSDLAFRA